MTRKTENFEFFGNKFRIKQFAAVRGMEILEKENLDPTEVLECTEVRTENGDWVLLDNDDDINKYVKDVINHIPPLNVMKILMSEVRLFNFRFLDGWAPVRIPSRFQSDAKSISSAYTQPIIANLMSEDYATLRELEEYYSLEDAFKMFNVMLTKAVNTALSHEAAEQKARGNR